MNRDRIAGYKPVLYAIYILYCSAGLGYALNSSPAIQGALRPVTYVVWAVLFFGGGLTALVGAVLNKHHVEAIALIALGGGLLVIVFTLLFSDRLHSISGVNYGLTMLLASSIGSLIIRGLVLRDQIRIREQMSKRIRDDHESD